MANDPLSQRIDEVSDGITGVFVALLHARCTIGDKHVTTFLDKVPERGEALWLRFKTFRDEEGVNPEFRTFNHFIASVVMPNPFPNG